MEMARKISPNSENSKKPNFSAPRFFATELTIRLVDVPISVQEPPRIPAKEIGSNNLDCGILNFSDRRLIILIKTMTTAVVLINADMPAVTTIKIGAIKKSGNDLILPILEVNHSITPFSSIAMAKIINAKTAIVAVLLKPLMASSGVTRPSNAKDTIIRNAILSTGNTSNAKRTTVVNSTKNTKMISNSIDFVCVRLSATSLSRNFVQDRSLIYSRDTPLCLPYPAPRGVQGKRYRTYPSKWTCWSFFLAPTRS